MRWLLGTHTAHAPRPRTFPPCLSSAVLQPPVHTAVTVPFRSKPQRSDLVKKVILGNFHFPVNIYSGTLNRGIDREPGSRNQAEVEAGSVDAELCEDMDSRPGGCSGRSACQSCVSSPHPTAPPLCG